ncbi:hypothetical protein ACIRF8_18365 [Streptomyces sp. NPDC102406]|uniref:hypothetical protein n=1 Tax=Streptomyces sp. NPDC102406 TaxID=3366171 RepID=UPI00381722A7
MDLPDDLIALQRSADVEGKKLERLDDGERETQRLVWFDAAAEVKAAVAEYAREHELNRHEVAQNLRQTVRHPPRPRE